MPTEAALEWKEDVAEVREWPEANESPAIWDKPAKCSSRASDFGRSDFAQQLRAEISRAKLILELEDDWDGQGSPRYSQATLDLAATFVNSHVRLLWDSYGLQSPTPTFGPGPDGSIDIHWKQPSWELLVNIPADANQMAAFYGDNYGAQKIRGSFDPKVLNLGIAQWLTN
jgi:hypothetical protein